MYQILIVTVYVIVLNMILLCILPLVLLAVLNTLVYLKLKEFSQCIEMHVRSESLQMKELKLAMVSCLIVAGEQDMFRVPTNTSNSVFIICHSVRWIPNMYELSQSVIELVRMRGNYSKRSWLYSV